MKKNSFKNKIWIYLSIFSLIILLAILILKILSSNVYYEFVKKRQIKNIANEIISTLNTEDYEDSLNILSYKKDICIEITENKSITYSTDSVSRGCLVNNSREINDYKTKFMNSGDESVIYKVTTPELNNKSLIYGIKVSDSSFVFISTSLEPIGLTNNIMNGQLLIIMFLILIVAFIISYSLSKKISKPLENINKLSKCLAKGNFNVVFDTKSDIKEITELEETLTNMASDLSKTEELRRELLANVSHDLKTPLTIIKANAEMIKDISYKNKEKREKNIGTIVEEVDRLNLLVEDILDLSKMQAGSIKLNKEKINIDELINSIIKRFSVLEENLGYKINYEGNKYYVLADKKKLEQVIYNLINNAINYTGDNKDIYINLKEEDNKVIVYIRDTGKGIDKEELSYIWDKYYKSDKKYKRVTYGTGLGLSIVKNILELHNFKYGVNTSNNGTIFYFEIDEYIE